MEVTNASPSLPLTMTATCDCLERPAGARVSLGRDTVFRAKAIPGKIMMPRGTFL